MFSREDGTVRAQRSLPKIGKSTKLARSAGRGKRIEGCEAFRDQRIGLRGTHTDGVWDVSRSRFVVAPIEERLGKIRRHQARL